MAVLTPAGKLRWVLLSVITGCSIIFGQVSVKDNLHFNALATSWDEGIPLGNGLIGALVWQKGGHLRFSLDRSDLWDLRPVKEFERPEFRYSWVRDQVLKRDYKAVQNLFDQPYDRDPAPTKIPAGALEFDISALGEVASVELSLVDAVCTVKWKNGARLTTFIHAGRSLGWFHFENLPAMLKPTLVPPPYGTAHDSMTTAVNSLNTSDLQRLGYAAPEVKYQETSSSFHQECYGGLSYDVSVRWIQLNSRTFDGVWSVSSRGSPYSSAMSADRMTASAIARSYSSEFKSHAEWWKSYWSRSSVSLPDPVLERQWYLEMYKFGAAARKGSPPITLQAVWTADNGKLPPWKGDYHNDLNTELSYWPSYVGNHLEEERSFLDWLWQNKPEFLQYTRTFFGTSGLNVPGVCTLTGQPMGGWIQYSFSPTMSAWLAQHFYWHWRYSMDREFLETRAYPWIKAVATHLDELSFKGADGKRKLPLSSSPEINDNDITAWFQETTNYDLALIRNLYASAAELAEELGKNAEAQKWKTILSQWPQLSVSENDGRLLVAPGIPLKESHRHFSHLMAIYPLGIVDWGNGDADRRTIQSSIAELKRLGPDWWCGYSYSWFGCLAACARDGETAAEALRTFATCFCLPNSFHVNGDQSGTGKSRMTYRPFTLEGNFAFAQGIHQMLLQNNNRVIRIFPAVPEGWGNISFSHLRAEGAFLISARKEKGKTVEVDVYPEQGGLLRLENPFGVQKYTVEGIPMREVKTFDNVLDVRTVKDKEIRFKSKSE
jgi:alpha-L-fucosidase 2